MFSFIKTFFYHSFLEALYISIVSITVIGSIIIFVISKMFKTFFMKRNPVRRYYFIDIHIIYQNLAFATVKFALFNFSIPRSYIFYPFFRYTEKNIIFYRFCGFIMPCYFFLNANFSLYLWLHLYLYNKFEFYNYFFERNNCNIIRRHRFLCKIMKPFLELRF